MNIQEAAKMLKGVPGVYQIHNAVSKKSYVGKGVDVGGRLADHLKGLRKGKHINYHLQASFNKHGEAVFEAFLITTAPVEDLNILEVHWIQELDTFKNGYNCTIGGDGGATRCGYKHSLETCAKISAALRGREMSPEWRAKISAANRDMSLETRAKISAALCGHKHTPEARAKMSTAHKNPSLETRAKLSAAHKNPSLETRAKLSVAGLGRKKSLETREKLSAALRGHSVSQETREKIRATLLQKKFL